MQLSLFEESDWQWSLADMPARLPTASWLSEFLACEAVAVHEWAEPDDYLLSVFKHGTDVHEVAALRYLNLDAVVEAGSRVDIEARVGAALIPELEPISPVGAVEVPFELVDDGTVVHVAPEGGKLPRKAQRDGIFGRADYAGRDIDGQLRVLDLKTGNPDYLQTPLLAWQLRAYGVMVWEAQGKKDEPVLLSYAAVRAGCREHTWGPWEPACPDCRRARPTAKATVPLLQSWADTLRKALVRARELVAGAPPKYTPTPRNCSRCRAREACPMAMGKSQALPAVRVT